MRIWRKAFGEMLAEKRRNRGLSLRALAQGARVKHTYLPLIHGGKRGVGPDMAERLADGLNLVGHERIEFLSAASKTLSKNKNESSGIAIHSVLGSWLASVLNRNGIDARAIEKFEAVTLCKRCNEVESSVWVGCVGNAKASSFEIDHILPTSKTGSAVFVVCSPDGSQAVIDCSVRLIPAEANERPRKKSDR